ncbi:MAG: SPOR domain-containing protein [Candidatus Omnitrophota bacterium]
MEKQGNSQLELFSQGSQPRDSGASQSNPFLTRIWSYEKTILIILAILVTGIAAFSLGVEKGKSIILDQARALIMLKAQNSQPLPQAAKNEVMVKQAANPVMQQGPFTIQVGSFKTKANALKEAEFIKKRGLGVMLFSKNGYFILCAGNFSSKESAASLLNELNKRYGNCQIRRL